MQETYFGSQVEMNSALFASSLTEDEALTIYTDPVYGLNNKDNYAKWDVLTNTSDPIANRQFKNELRFYFGLTYLQSALAEYKWNMLFWKELDFIETIIPGNYNNF